jgi:hypothetical protein
MTPESGFPGTQVKKTKVPRYVVVFAIVADESYTGQLPLALDLCKGTHGAVRFNSGSGLLAGAFSRLAGATL